MRKLPLNTTGQRKRNNLRPHPVSLIFIWENMMFFKFYGITLAGYQMLNNIIKCMPSGLQKQPTKLCKRALFVIPTIPLIIILHYPRIMMVCLRYWCQCPRVGWQVPCHQKQSVARRRQRICLVSRDCRAVCWPFSHQCGR